MAGAPLIVFLLGLAAYLWFAWWTSPAQAERRRLSRIHKHTREARNGNR